MYYKAAYRNIAGVGDQNVSIWTMYPFGVAAGETGRNEFKVWNRPNAYSLGVCAVMNCTVPDWLLQIRVRSHVNAFMLNGTPVIAELLYTPLAVHSALRLICNHSGYAPLWEDQLVKKWREGDKTPFTWPVLASDDERWSVRAAVDSMVANAYGLSRDHYHHVLCKFNHKSYPNAPTLCLAMFDEIKLIGLDAFTRRHDPYWDIPVNKSLPQPVIDLPIPSETAEVDRISTGGDEFRLSGQASSKTRTRKKKS